MAVTVLSALLVFVSCGSDDSEDTAQAATPTPENSQNGLVFEKNQTGWTVTGATSKFITKIDIPETYKNEAVTTIATNAFKNIDSIEEVIIPKSITYIGARAFSGCTGIKELTIKSESLEISSFAFENAKAVNVKIPASAMDYIPKEYVKSLTITSGEVQNNAFTSFPRLEIIGIGSMNVSFAPGAFEGCEVEKFSMPLNLVKSFSLKKRVYSLTLFPSDSAQVGVISENFFEGYVGLYSITLQTGNGATYSIQDGAFNGCTARKFTVPANLMRYLPSSLTSLTVTEGVIEYLPSTSAMALEVLIIDTGVTDVNQGAFRDCKSLRTVSFLPSSELLREQTFINCESLISIDIGNNITSIKKKAFENCKSLTELTFGGKIAIIEDNAFKKCTSLKSITFENCVNSVGAYAFNDCTSLESVAIGSSLSSIDYSAFYGCKSLKYFSVNDQNPSYMSVSNSLYTKDGKILIRYGYSGTTHLELPLGLEEIRPEAFYMATDLVTVAMPNTVTKIGNDAFYGCSSLNYVVLSNKVTEIEQNTFRECSLLSTIVLPTSVKTIYKNAFYGCSSLESLTLSEGLERIDEQAFYNCDALAHVEIPLSVTTIGERIFASCDSLQAISCYATEPQPNWHEGWSRGNDAEIFFGLESVG